jgi:hypothetical protein
MIRGTCLAGDGGDFAITELPMLPFVNIESPTVDFVHPRRYEHHSQRRTSGSTDRLGDNP